MNIKHYGYTQDQMRAKNNSTGDFDGKYPACGNGSWHVELTNNRAHVTCAACLIALDPAKRGPLNSYKVPAVAELAAEIKAAGYRVFLAESGTYGFFTDAEGARVVCFQFDLGGFKFSGNYRSKSCGTGWIMGDAYGVSPEGLAAMIESRPPHWATKGEAVQQTTLAQHLQTYQLSSRYTELLEAQ